MVAAAYLVFIILFSFIFFPWARWIAQLLRKWLHRGAAMRGWEEIYSHLEDYVQQPIADETDTAGMVTALESSHGIDCKYKCHCERDEEDEDSHTVIRYKDLTITICGKLTIGNDLVSLSIYEHLCLLDGENRIIRPRHMLQRDGGIVNQFGLPPTNKPIPFIPLNSRGPKRAGILLIAGRRKSQQVRIFNGTTGSYLMIEKTKNSDRVPYSVFVAPRNGRIGALSTFNVNLKDRPTVLHLHDNPDYALRFDTRKQEVIVQRYVSGDQRFKFDLDPVGNPKCDCNIYI